MPSPVFMSSVTWFDTRGHCGLRSLVTVVFGVVRLVRMHSLA
jgi:hypothetical protein